MLTTAPARGPLAPVTVPDNEPDCARVVVEAISRAATEIRNVFPERAI
jgi:hypothetical protein